QYKLKSSNWRQSTKKRKVCKCIKCEPTDEHSCSSFYCILCLYLCVCFRHLQLNKKSEELLEQYRYEIQDVKLKHRKLRMRFENQLHQLIDQHKNLHYVFTPERLPDELKSVENTKSQLLAAEKLKLTQLHNLDEELEKMKNQKQAQEAAAETQE
uniref:Uncharacterized protein n=1 Tax=Maylandia zebra TaxID=106582 RepID=A0A3P9B7L1_9CICH